MLNTNESWVESSEVEVEVVAPAIKEASPQASEKETNPIVSQHPELTDHEANLDSPKKKSISPKTKIVCSLASASILFQILSLVMKVPSAGNVKRWVLMIAALIGLILGAVVYVVQYRILEKMETFRDVLNEVREKVNKLKVINAELTSNVDDLKNQTNRLQNSEQAMEKIAKDQSKNVNSIVEATKENKNVLNSMDRVIKMKLIHDFYGVILRSDRNRDMTIEDDEVDILALRMSNIPGIDINTDAFVARARLCGGSLDKIFGFIEEHIGGRADPNVDSPFEVNEEKVKEELTF